MKRRENVPDKRASLLVLRSMVVIIVALIAISLVGGIFSKFIRTLVSSASIEDAKNSFSSFASQLDSMDEGGQAISLKMRKNSAIIGFSKASQKFQCQNCRNLDQKIITINRPQHDACKDSSCVCLCLKFEIKSDTQDFCTAEKENLICKKLSKKNVLDFQPIQKDPRERVIKGTSAEVNMVGGFMYLFDATNDLHIAMQLINSNFLKVESTADGTIGVCTTAVLDLHSSNFNENSCVLKLPPNIA